MRRASVFLVLVPLLAACGAKEGGLESAPGAMKDAGSSRVELRLVGAKVAFVGSGAIDYAHERGQLVITDESGGRLVPGGQMEGRFLGKTTYLGWNLFDDRQWVKETDDAPSGTDRLIPGFGGPSPDRLLGLLIKSSKEIEGLGNEEIRGVSTKHYRAHVDPMKLGEDDVFAENAELVVDVWVDGDQLVRRLRVPEAGEDEAGATVFDFFDFGVEVDVEAPPADQVRSDEEFENLLEKWCRAQPKKRDEDFCAFGVGEGGGGGVETGKIETMPVETEKK
jgi:hypothetical protein